MRFIDGYLTEREKSTSLLRLKNYYIYTLLQYATSLPLVSSPPINASRYQKSARRIVSPSVEFWEAMNCFQEGEGIGSCTRSLARSIFRIGRIIRFVTPACIIVVVVDLAPRDLSSVLNLCNHHKFQKLF